MITKNELWTAWKEWSADEGLTPGTKANLLKNVYAVVPGARPTKPRDGDGREPSVAGLALRVGPTMQNSPDHPDQGTLGPGTRAAHRPRKNRSTKRVVRVVRATTHC